MDEFAEKVAASSESNGSSALKKDPPSVISTQLRDELIRILTTGDAKKDGAFTIAVAAHVEKFAVAAREILMTERLAQNDLGSLMRMRKHHLGGPWSGVIGSSANVVGDDGFLPLPTTYNPINNENFGVQAIRQVIDAVRTMSESPAKIVEAIAAARSNNLDDVATALEKKLGVSKESAPALQEGPVS